MVREDSEGQRGIMMKLWQVSNGGQLQRDERETQLEEIS